jgi:CrcB protein
MAAYFWIGLGSALGGMARHWCTGLATQLAGAGFPWGTLIVNVTGSLIIGVAIATMGGEGRFAAGPSTQQFVIVGLCGGYTTFSAFSLQTLTLIQAQQWGAAAANVIASVAACLIAVWLGVQIGQLINPP